MKLFRILLINLLTLTSFAASASGRTVMCDAPMGPRLDYFTQNTANLQNNQFLVGNDQMSDVHVRVVLNDNNQDVSFAVGSMAQLQAIPEVNNMKVVDTTKDQVSFFGKVNDAPILATYYPAMSIIVYTQQSVWPGDSFSGARAMLFYARCHVFNPAVPATGQQMPAAGQPMPAPSQPAEEVQGLAVPADAVPPATTTTTTTTTTPAPASADAPAASAPAAPAPAAVTPAASAPAVPAGQ